MATVGYWIGYLTDKGAAEHGGGRHDSGTVLVTQKGALGDQHLDGMTKAGQLKWVFFEGDTPPDFTPKLHKLPQDLSGAMTADDVLALREETVKGKAEREGK